MRSAGSGVIVDAKNGYILTNHHVVENANEIEVACATTAASRPRVVGSDEGTDIAVLKLNEPGPLTQIAARQFRPGAGRRLRASPSAIPSASSTPSRRASSARLAAAASARTATRTSSRPTPPSTRAIPAARSINLKGELIGINSAIFSNSGGNIGIGFAIPVNIAKSIMAQILQYGKVRRGLLGVSISDFSADTAKAYGVDAREGALVQEVVSGSAAEKAGIEVGDVIVAVDGEPSAAQRTCARPSA